MNNEYDINEMKEILRRRTIFEPVGNIKMKRKILDHFKLPSCSTCHSV